MSAEILKPFGEYLTPGVDADVVTMLREILAKAEHGELVAVAIAGVMQNGCVLTRANIGSRGTGELLGAVCVLQTEICEEWRAR